MDVATPSAVSGVKLLSPAVVRVPVKTILYRQAIAENGQGDGPKPIGVALPSGHISYPQ
jgi:hypothetical protein